MSGSVPHKVVPKPFDYLREFRGFDGELLGVLRVPAFQQGQPEALAKYREELAALKALEGAVDGEELEELKRGEVSAVFSSKSRRSLSLSLMLHSHLFRENETLFLSLTLGGGITGASYRELKVWLQALVRRHPSAFWFWCLEFQKRGAPHWHLLLSLGSNISDDELCDFRDWAASAWVRIAGVGTSSTFDRLRYGVDVRRVYDTSGASVYMVSELSKTASKVRPENAPSGRWWGRGGAFPALAIQPVEFDAFDYRLPFGVVLERLQDIQRLMFPKGYSNYVDSRGFEIEIIPSLHFGAFARYIYGADPEAVAGAWERCVAITTKAKEKNLRDYERLEAIPV